MKVLFMAVTKQEQPKCPPVLLGDEDSLVYPGSEISFENEKGHFPAYHSIQEP